MLLPPQWARGPLDCYYIILSGGGGVTEGRHLAGFNRCASLTLLRERPLHEGRAHRLLQPGGGGAGAGGEVEKVDEGKNRKQDINNKKNPPNCRRGQLEVASKQIGALLIEAGQTPH